ncbi:MAG TPA: hypothetical protein VHK89_07625 [Actinomycetota bacterium]|nr:hypothetical protein [Actinomycetota bacterium]
MRARLAEVEERLRPGRAHSWAVERLGELFAQGRAPDPPPRGELAGRWLVVSFSGVVDALERRIAALHMPWLGKRFDPATATGVNVLTRGARIPLSLLWPAAGLGRERGDGRIEGVPFRTWSGHSAGDPGLRVLFVDYDLDANPPWARRVRDEVVDAGEGVYLGRTLLRVRDGVRPLGYFTLE